MKIKDKIAVLISVLALLVALVSIYFSCEANITSKSALKLSEIINTPFLDARLENFKSGTYYKVEKNETGINLKIKFELHNTGNVPITVTSVKLAKLEVESQKTPYPGFEDTLEIIIAPKTSKFYYPIFGLSLSEKTPDEIFERSNSSGFNFTTEWKFNYHSEIKENEVNQIIVGYKITKDTATIIKNEMQNVFSNSILSKSMSRV